MRPTAAQKTEFGLWLERTLASRNINKRAFADQIGAHETAVSHWIHGRRTPPPDMLARMARILNVDVVALQVTAHVINSTDVGVEPLPLPAEDPIRAQLRQQLERTAGLTGHSVDEMMKAYDRAVRTKQGDE